ncbi:hypothetical protein [Micromonospora sp. NPDC023814]|uniref:hypothetical protein n=1 Tax=Micromonospora sp. NPDC023814 TaxID=3154596 RepID=UPI003401FE55
MLLVLNELSYRDVKARREEVSTSLRDLVTLIRRVRQHREDVALVTETRFFDLALADGYTVREWASDGRNRDFMRFMLAMRNRAPFRDVTPADRFDEVEYLHQGLTALGLGVAHLMGGLAVSLRLAPVWETPWLELTQLTLGENDEGELGLLRTEVPVRHACATQHVDEHQRWMCESELNRLHSGAEVWAARSDVFPHLRFLSRVADDLDKLPADWLHPVKERLAELELTVAEWRLKGGPAPVWRSKITPESETRKSLCWFTDEQDGNSHIFEWHARFTPRAGRLHFRLDGGQRTLVIAYIGAKL